MAEQIASTYALTWINKIAEIPQAAWDTLAVPLATPFLEWEWLHTLEASGSITPQTGWLPHHLTIWRDRTLVAAAPLYLKGHSYGEFVFDQQWAELAYRLGIEYYPKLVGMVPVTPAVGYRFLIAPNEDEVHLTTMMVQAIHEFCDRHRISSCHFLYVDPNWRSLMERQGFIPWLHHSYIWSNQGFNTFEDYLAIFNANQRRNIRRDRKAVAKAGLGIRTFTGDEISQSLLAQMYQFYSYHCDKFGWWGSKYLNRQFFERLHSCYRHRVLLVAAYTDSEPDHPLGMSFCLTKGRHLYGRYWGCHQEVDCLHFEVCYYTPIAWSIDRGIQSFDPGAGGQHKTRRGFPATPNHSLHRFYHNHLDDILQPYIQKVNALEKQEIAAMNQGLSFTKIALDDSD